ncbi:MAG: hypothetical protein WD115_02115 [Balneolaceae bacterium]
MSIYLLFIDGIGFGLQSEDNPFSMGEFDSLNRWSGGRPWVEGYQNELIGERSRVWSVDACLNVEGLPQSGTGQASLFTGINCSRRAGKHFGPFPHSTSKPVLKKKSLFHQWISVGGNPLFINAYPDRFFQSDSIPKRWSCTTYMSVHSGLRLNRQQDVLEGRALTAELDQQVWRDRLGLNVPLVSMNEAASRMIKMGDTYDLILFEYYLSDRAGHKQNMGQAMEILTRLNGFLGELMEQMGEEDTLVICSDHGNMEDLSIRTHTRNRVPMGVYGAGYDSVVTPPNSLTDLPELLLQIRGRTPGSVAGPES